jgi:hypothetical protein
MRICQEIRSYPYIFPQRGLAMKKVGLSFKIRGILWLLTGLLFSSFLIPSLSNAGTTTIGNYILVSKTPVGRTAYDYVYRASATNGNEFDLKNVQATVTSKVSSTQVIDGSLTFGNVQVGGTVSSSDTFTLRINLTSTFKESDLVWTVTYDIPDLFFQTVVPDPCCQDQP